MLHVPICTTTAWGSSEKRQKGCLVSCLKIAAEKLMPAAAYSCLVTCLKIAAEELMTAAADSCSTSDLAAKVTFWSTGQQV